jgi:hypothetical protein
MQPWWYRDYALAGQDAQWVALRCAIEPGSATERIRRRSAALREQSQIVRERAATLRTQAEILRARGRIARRSIPLRTFQSEPPGTPTR